MPAFNISGLRKLKGKSFSVERFERVINGLFKNGFINVNGSINTLANYDGYKAYLQIEEFQDLNGHKIVLEFIKEMVNGHVLYHIKDVEVD
jgi:hypothetical protein